MDVNLEVVSIPVSDVDKALGVLPRTSRLAARRRHQERRRIPRRPDHPDRRGPHLDRLRQRHSDGHPGLDAAPGARDLRHRRRPEGAGRTWHRRDRGLPRSRQPVPPASRIPVPTPIAPATPPTPPSTTPTETTEPSKRSPPPPRPRTPALIPGIAREVLAKDHPKWVPPIGRNTVAHPPKTNRHAATEEHT